MSIALAAQPLTRKAFAPFGDVIEAAGHTHFPINAGTSERFHDLARVEAGEEGTAALSIFRTTPRSLPMRIAMLERHPLGSQAFMPISPRRFAVVVAPRGDEIVPESVQAFVAATGQGLNLYRGVWHHPLIALDAGGDFLVVDRIGPGKNQEEHLFPGQVEIVLDCP